MLPLRDVLGVNPAERVVFLSYGKGSGTQNKRNKLCENIFCFVMTGREFFFLMCKCLPMRRNSFGINDRISHLLHMSSTTVFGVHAYAQCLQLIF